MSTRQYNLFDRLLVQGEQAMRTLVPGAAQAARPSPAQHLRSDAVAEDQRRHVAGLMRINHTGEVCAQALYQGQALTAKLPDIREQMEQAAAEEIDHLAWCEQRLNELGSRPSLLNPLFYGLSFGLGAVAGRISDRISLGFVAATEQLVERHLDDHLTRLPKDDLKSRAILEQMRDDEIEHANHALQAGGVVFPRPIKGVMKLMSRVMTSATYRI
ncbi:MAG: 2-polyprenyl-3-methyl-6-methoxy-1,4-benzoquinone monooxygenase [Pseudomonadaceae bacterium]|jgi:ubiquinone biosynthesis monooxygenase Coq7|uniref:3-demethoxyubiquinol 3-hydroxylase n=1 Tax=Halopseudomonas formosensis TaxID=1002526 RepID=A0A1I6C569_9GAMM|nr:2-polyprenyl-3-methyl-6-methoxy-1,4-benzoquinone monooxygenase [Halopseudomonas formosensis]MDY3198226.1 2-polyprenyl-3-methyl-6-methoxy-1,4-benzoquinone monooxygenase [Pseudomonadaceae bacterium]SFQ88195.1 ubiquinone biosynthesis monooxygenase Coq7 [Halopseudomonas formosensis]